MWYTSLEPPNPVYHQVSLHHRVARGPPQAAVCLACPDHLPSQPRVGPSNVDGNGISTYNRNKRNKNYGGNVRKQRRE